MLLCKAIQNYMHEIKEISSMSRVVTDSNFLCYYHDLATIDWVCIGNWIY
jgi:hypothetical protein